MFKKSIILSFILAAFMATSLVCGDDKPIIDLTKYSAPKSELYTAIARTIFAFSCANAKEPGRIRLALTDLARITNEALAYYNYVDKKKVTTGTPNIYQNNEIRNIVSPTLITLEILSFIKHIFAGGEKRSGDKKLRGLSRFIDCKLLPAIEGGASIIRAIESIRSTKAAAASTNHKLDYWCSVFIIYSRLLSTMINSGVGSKALGLEIVAGLIVSLMVINNIKPELNKNVMSLLNTLTLHDKSSADENVLGSLTKDSLKQSFKNVVDSAKS